MKVHEIVDFLEKKGIKNQLVGDDGAEISTFCSLFDLKDDAITWVRYIEDVKPENFEKVSNTLLLAELGNEKDYDFSVLYVEDVHSSFFQIIEYFFASENPNNVAPCIEPSAVVMTKEIGENVYIGHNSYVGEDVVIGDNVRILHNVSIQGKVTIGDNCLIESCTVVGATGYGHYVDNKGVMRTAPHLCGVSIGNNVEIGCNCCVERGCLADTVIEDGVFIDNLSHIGHNVLIKKHAMIVGAKIGGSTTVEENVWVGFGSTVADQTVIGDNSYIGMGTVVTKEVPSNKVMVGVPAKVLRENDNKSKVKHKNR